VWVQEGDGFIIKHLKRCTVYVDEQMGKIGMRQGMSLPANFQHRAKENLMCLINVFENDKLKP